MREIPLTKGQVAIVDDDDYPALAGFAWIAVWNAASRTFYARTGLRAYMHRIVAWAPTGTQVDHKNHDGLDNRRENIRLCTPVQNQRNKRPSGRGTSAFKGVSAHVRRSGATVWQARLRVDGRQVHVGYFCDEMSAASAYDAAARRHFGEFASLNFPETAGQAEGS